MGKEGIEVNLLNPIILAENHKRLVEWYIQTFDLSIKYRVEEPEHYTALEQSGKLVVGIAIASEMGVKPTIPRNNAVIVQISVLDIHKLFVKVEKMGGKILFGPSTDEKEGYLYGGLADIEGNQIWVVEPKKNVTNN